jgi:hypothetical protein
MQEQRGHYPSVQLGPSARDKHKTGAHCHSEEKMASVMKKRLPTKSISPILANQS